MNNKPLSLLKEKKEKNLSFLFSMQSGFVPQLNLVHKISSRIWYKFVVSAALAVTGTLMVIGIFL